MLVIWPNDRPAANPRGSTHGVRKPEQRRSWAGTKAIGMTFSETLNLSSDLRVAQETIQGHYKRRMQNRPVNAA